jgi:hypothetical protein
MREFKRHLIYAWKINREAYRLAPKLSWLYFPRNLFSILRLSYDRNNMWYIDK